MVGNRMSFFSRFRGSSAGHRAAPDSRAAGYVFGSTPWAPAYVDLRSLRSRSLRCSMSLEMRECIDYQEGNIRDADSSTGHRRNKAGFSVPPGGAGNRQRTAYEDPVGTFAHQRDGKQRMCWRG